MCASEALTHHISCLYLLSFCYLSVWSIELRWKADPSYWADKLITPQLLHSPIPTAHPRYSTSSGLWLSLRHEVERERDREQKKQKKTLLLWQWGTCKWRQRSAVTKDKAGSDNACTHRPWAECWCVLTSRHSGSIQPGARTWDSALSLRVSAGRAPHTNWAQMAFTQLGAGNAAIKQPALQLWWWKRPRVHWSCLLYFHAQIHLKRRYLKNIIIVDF